MTESVQALHARVRINNSSSELIDKSDQNLNARLSSPHTFQGALDAYDDIAQMPSPIVCFPETRDSRLDVPCGNIYSLPHSPAGARLVFSSGLLYLCFRRKEDSIRLKLNKLHVH